MADKCKEKIAVLQSRIRCLEEELHRYKYDQLTGLLMRRDFDNDLFSKEENNERFWLTLVDVNDLHIINRTKGYRYGDLTLRKVATTLINNARHCGGVVYRIGGDEFAILSKEMINLNDLNGVTTATQFSTGFESTEELFDTVDSELILKKERRKKKGE